MKDGGGEERKKTRVFSELQSHYLSEDKFGRPGKGNDKGKVQGLVGYPHRNFLVPVPRVESREELNAHLLEECGKRRERWLRGQNETIAERFERNHAVLLPLVPVCQFPLSLKHIGWTALIAVGGNLLDRREKLIRLDRF